MCDVHRVRNKTVLEKESEGAEYFRSYRAEGTEDGLAAQNLNRDTHVCTI